MLRNRIKSIGLFYYEYLVRTIKQRRGQHIVNYRQYVSPKVAFPVSLSLAIPFFGYNTIKTNEQPSTNIKKDLGQKLIEADQLFLEDKYDDVVHLLEQYKEESDVQVLWRLSRAEYNISLAENISEEKRKSLISSAYESIIKALSINSEVFEVHKWAAILIDEYSQIIGIKERIKNLETVKSHMQRALELNPKDSTTRYMIGYWCYSVADMPWYQRKIASTIFGADIPTSTYEEALEYFREAESMQPLFYSKNLLMLGKTFLKMDNKFSAEYYLKLVTQYPAKTVEDHQAKKEAASILKSSLGC